SELLRLYGTRSSNSKGYAIGGCASSTVSRRSCSAMPPILPRFRPIDCPRDSSTVSTATHGPASSHADPHDSGKDRHNPANCSGANPQRRGTPSHSTGPWAWRFAIEHAIRYNNNVPEL